MFLQNMDFFKKVIFKTLHPAAVNTGKTFAAENRNPNNDALFTTENNVYIKTLQYKAVWDIFLLLYGLWSDPQMIDRLDFFYTSKQ